MGYKFKEESINTGYGKEDTFKQAKKDAIRAAKDLKYPDNVINKLKSCNTLGQLSIVMTTARQTYL